MVRDSCTSHAQSISISGITDVKLLNQSTATAIAYKWMNPSPPVGYSARNSNSQRMVGKPLTSYAYNLALLSMGERSCEVSVFGMSADGELHLRLTNGTSTFGGADFTECIVRRVLRAEAAAAPFPPPADTESSLPNGGVDADPEQLKLLWYECERAKCTLSEMDRTV